MSQSVLSCVLKIKFFEKVSKYGEKYMESKVKRPAQGHTANRWWGQDVNQVFSDTQTITTIPTSFCVATSPGHRGEFLAQKVPRAFWHLTPTPTPFPIIHNSRERVDRIWNLEYWALMHKNTQSQEQKCAQVTSQGIGQFLSIAGALTQGRGHCINSKFWKWT